MNSQKHSKEKALGIAWFVIPAVWVVAALAGLVILTYWPSLLADQLPEHGSAASNVFQLAPSYVSSDPSLPAAGTVFKDRSYEASEHVDQF
jgi:hypothetical protein